MMQLPFPLDWIQAQLLETRFTIRISIRDLIFFSVVGFFLYKNFQLLRQIDLFRLKVKRSEVKDRLADRKFNLSKSLTDRELHLRDRELYLQEKELQLKKAKLFLSLNPSKEKEEALNKLIHDLIDELSKDLFSSKKKRENDEKERT
jgi:hypothetical protein